MRSYATYIRAMGGVVVFVFLLASFIVSIVIQSLTTGYLAYWFSQGDGNMVSVVSGSSCMVYLGIQQMDTL